LWQQLHSKARSGLEAATSIQEMEIFSGEQIQAKVGLGGVGCLGWGIKFIMVTVSPSTPVFAL